ncbi:hypothetical protein [Streptomyces sp. NPDC056240]|uniref:hypothetical protein n=1 Tax=Streptomyces sp. NPDC056240 TaxID=3345759 RepID=UPI0035DED010
MIEQYTVATRRIPVRQQQLGLQVAQSRTGLVARHVRRDVVGSRVLDAGRSGQPVTAAAAAAAADDAGSPRLVRGRVEERQRWRRRRTRIEAILTTVMTIFESRL